MTHKSVLAIQTLPKAYASNLKFDKKGMVNLQNFKTKKKTTYNKVSKHGTMSA